MKTPASRLHQLSAAIGEHLHQFEEVGGTPTLLEEIPLTREDEYGCCGSLPSGPTLYVSGRKDPKVFDLPKEGTAKVNYRIRSKSVNYREDGTERYSTDIEVKTIEPTDLEAVVERYVGGTPTLHDFGDRARDAAGRYAPGRDVSADEMAAAYGRKKKKRAALAVGATAALAAGAVAGRKAGPAISQGAGRLLRRASGVG